MVKVSKLGYKNKYKEHVENHKKRSKKVHHHQKRYHKDQKNALSKLTSARLTVPHLQTGIFLKGKSSTSYHREKETNLNRLNKARMNEKLTEILNHAKSKSNEDVIQNDTQDIHDLKSEMTVLSPSSLLSTTTQQCERKECESECYKTERTLGSSSGEESPINKNKNLQETINTNFQVSCNPNNTGQNDADYIYFKMFLTHFDNTVSMAKTTREDFIAREKLDLKRKKRIFLGCNSAKASDAQKSETILSSYYHTEKDNEEIKKEQKGTSEDENNINITNTNTKVNPSYKLPNKPLKEKIININKQQKKNHTYFNHKNKFPSDYIIENTHIFKNKASPGENHASLLNPMKFLTSSFQERNNDLSSQLPTKNCSFDGYQFLKHTLDLPSASTPLESVISNKQRTLVTPFKSLSQQYQTLDKNETTNYKKIEVSATHNQSPFIPNSCEDYLKTFSYNNTERNHNLSKTIFTNENEPFCVLDDIPVTDELLTFNSPLKLDKHPFASSHNSITRPKKSKSTPSLPDKTIFGTYETDTPKYSQRIEDTSYLPFSALEDRSKYNAIEERWNSSQQNYDHPTSHLVKIGASSTAFNTEVDDRDSTFWHRRRMF